MTYRGAEDPAPDRDLPSDIAFRLFLLSLTPQQVQAERVLVHTQITRRWVEDARRRQKL